MIIHSASETAPDFYAHPCWHSGLKTPDRRLDGAFSLTGLMMKVGCSFRSTAPYAGTLCGYWLKTYH
jgi:hypothetical protein